jgi:hypothetical protein
LYFASIAVVATEPGVDEVTVRHLLERVVTAVTHIEMADDLVDREALYKAIVDRFREQSPEVAESMADFIASAVPGARVAIRRAQRTRGVRRRSI